MDKTRLSIDSLGESEVERLRDTLRQKEAIITEKSEIINSLRQQVTDLKDELEEMENNQQVLIQKVDRLTKQIEEKNEHLEAVSHSLQEVETAHDNLSSKYEARIGQVKELFDDLKKTKKDLEKAQSLNEELRHKNERLTVELEMADTRKRVWLEEEQQQRHRLRMTDDDATDHENKLFHHRQNITRNNQSQQPPQQFIKQQQQPLSSKLPDAENRHEFTPALHFPIAEEVGEIMDSSSVLPLTPTTVNRPRQRHAPVQSTLTTTIKSGGDSNNDHLNRAVASLDIDDENLPYRGYNIYQHHHQQQQTELMSRNDNNNSVKQYCSNHQPKSIEEEKVLDPIEEYKMRVARANELARRNKLTKPLHQTSYALELDTFDTTELTEQEIKRGNVAKAAAAALSKARQQPPPALSTRSQHQRSAYTHHQHHEQQSHRRALVDRVNTTPVARRVYKKAEAFIV